MDDNYKQTDDDTDGPVTLRELFPKPDAGEVPDLARAYLACRKHREAAEEALKRIREQADEAELELMTAMELSGLLSVRVQDEDGKPVTLSPASTTYYSLPAGSLEDAVILRWLMTSGGDQLVKKTIHHATFSSFCRELVESGKDLPVNVKITARKYVQVRG